MSSMPLQVIMTIVAIGSALTYMPTNPDDHDPPVLQVRVIRQI